MQEKITLKEWADRECSMPKLWLVNWSTHTPIGRMSFAEYYGRFGEWTVKQVTSGGLYNTYADVYIRPPQRTFKVHFWYYAGIYGRKDGTEEITVNDDGNFGGTFNELIGYFSDRTRYYDAVEIMWIEEVSKN